MAVITVSFGGGKTAGRFNCAELREKLGQHQCTACQRVFNEHTDEELDKCMDEIFPIMKRVRERHRVEFHIPDKEYSQEERDALVRQIAAQVKNHSKAESMKIAAELKAWQKKRNEN